MKVYDTAAIRNVAVVGHGGAGKTSLVAALLYASRGTDKLGSVAEGTTVTDFETDEIERKVSMAVAAAYTEFRDTKINFIDAPGYTSFIGEAYAALRGADAALITVHAVDGIGVQTEKMFEEAEKQNLPVLFAITQLDRERADFEEAAKALHDNFGAGAVPVALPIGSEKGVTGVVCLVTGKAFTVQPGSPEARTGEVPAGMKDAFEAGRQHLMEAVAESDEELFNVMLENGTLDEVQFAGGLRKAVATRALFPIFAAAGPALVGAHQILEGLVGFAPSPAERPPVKTKADDGSEHEHPPTPQETFVAQVVKTYIDPFAGRISLVRVFSGSVAADGSVFNADHGLPEKMAGLTAPRGKGGEKMPQIVAGDLGLVFKLKDTHTGDTLCADKAHAGKLPPITFPRPVIAYAVHGEAKGDEEKIAEALKKLAEEDPTIKIDRDSRSHELMLSGLGADHVKIVTDKVEKRFKIKAHLQKPKVPYLETITRKAQTMYRHKKQTGGAGQFAEVHMRIEPLPRGGGFEYASEIFGGTISRNFWPSIEKGVKSVLERGAIAGYPLVDVKAVIFDGKEHPVDSKDIAFQVAGREVFKACVREAGAVVLEPIMQVVVTAPDEYMGDILGDLTRRRGKPLGSDNAGGKTKIRALVPMSEMLEYSATLKSLTSDRADYTMSLDHYEKVPADVQQKLMADYKPHETED